MSETYYDSAEDLTITQERAFEELAKHGCQDIHQFILDMGDNMGDKEEYNAQKVLEWLGY
jgi:hypothetical protein